MGTGWPAATPAIFAVTVLWLTVGPKGVRADGPQSGELDTRRLLGKAYYENDKFAEAAREFSRCTELAPSSAADLAAGPM